MLAGDLLPDVTFELYEYDGDGTVITKRYKGPWILVDNGYLKWSTTVPPFKVTVDEKERRWSHWLESLRKDVECTFGILKGRWRILKTGIRLQGNEVATNIWFTCCALHNWLLEVDGIDGEWDGALGMQDANDVTSHVPFSLQRLQLGFDPRLYDASGIGPGEDVQGLIATMETVNNRELHGAEHNAEAEVGGCRIVRYLSLNYFRNKLIQHFDIMFKRYELVWPQRRVQIDIN